MQTRKAGSNTDPHLQRPKIIMFLAVLMILTHSNGTRGKPFLK